MRSYVRRGALTGARAGASTFTVAVTIDTKLVCLGYKRRIVKTLHSIQEESSGLYIETKPGKQPHQRHERAFKRIECHVRC